MTIEVKGVRIFSKTTPCAHSCRYCLVGKKKVTEVAFPRFAHLVERFIDWRRTTGNPRFTILAGFEDSYEFSVETLKGLFEIYKKVGWNEEECNGIKLGGLKWRTREEMRTWLIARRDNADLKIVHASLAGHGSTHDRWNGRKGDFDYLFQTLATAAELGLRIHQRIFVVKSSLPLLDRLLDKLDEIPGEALRYVTPFVYQGNAIRLENERITETIRDHLPERIVQISQRTNDRWLSEREWIEERGEEIKADFKRPLNLDLEITEDNLDRLETMACDDILAELTNEAQSVHAELPNRSELLKDYAEPANDRIYTSLGELERKWLTRYLIEHSLDPAEAFTNFAA